MSTDRPGTSANGFAGAQVDETSAPEICHESLSNSADNNSAVTPLSRNLDRDSQLASERPDVAASIRAARQQLEGQPEHNAITIGHRSAHLQAALEPVRTAIYEATLSDLGYPKDGPERPSEALRMTARNLASLDVLAETFWTWIESRGPVTSKGRTRSAVNTLLSIIDRQTKLAATIGLERKARDVSRMSAAEYVEQQRQRTEPSA